VRRNRFSAVTALSLALLAAPAFAQGFTDAAASGLAKLGVQAPPVEMLTTEQVAQITNILASNESDSTKRTQIEGVLGNEATATGRLGFGQLQDSVAADLAALGVDAEGVEMLTISQLAEIENVMAGQDPSDVKRMRVEEIIDGEATATGRLGVTQLQDSVAADLASLGIDAEGVGMLTIAQLGQIENVMASSDSRETKRARVERIMAE
jgi:hypothetical protein